MTDRRIDTLMNEVLDGTATPADVARLESMLTADADLRRRFDELKRLHDWLSVAPREGAPSGLVRDVMEGLESPARRGSTGGNWLTKLGRVVFGGTSMQGSERVFSDGERRNTSRPPDSGWGFLGDPLLAGGRGMKKVLFGVGVLALGGIVYFGLNSSTTTTPGVEGTIGVANRYQESQITSEDVVLGDESINEIIQTELFHELVTNPDFRKLVTSENFQKIARAEAFKGYIANVEVQQAYATIDYERSRTVMKNVQSAADLEKFVAESPELQKLVGTSEFGKLLATSPEAARTLLSPELGKLVSSSDGFRNAFLNANYGRIVGRPEIQKFISQADAERRLSY